MPQCVSRKGAWYVAPGCTIDSILGRFSTFCSVELKRRMTEVNPVILIVLKMCLIVMEVEHVDVTTSTYMCGPLDELTQITFLKTHLVLQQIKYYWDRVATLCMTDKYGQQPLVILGMRSLLDP